MATRQGPPPIVFIAAGLGVIGGLYYYGRDFLNLNPAPSTPAPLSTSAPTARATADGTPLMLLGDTFSGYSTFRNGEFLDTLGDRDIALSYRDEFVQATRAEQLSNGQADLIVTTLDQVLRHQPDGQIIGLLDRTVGADAVVLNTPQFSSLRSLNDLDALVEQSSSSGQPLSIVYAADTPSEYLARVLDIRFESFNLSDFELIEVAEASEAWDLLQQPNNNVAIAVLWEPFVTRAEREGYTVVLSSEDAPNAILDVIVASDRAIANHSDDLSDLLSAYYRRIDSNLRDSGQLRQQIQDDGGLSQTEASAVMQGIDFFTSVEADRWMSDGTLSRRISSTAAVLVLSGQMDTVPDNPEALYSAQFLSDSVANTETLISLIEADNPELAQLLAGTVSTTTSSAPAVSTASLQSAPTIGNLQVRGEVQFATGSAQLTPVGRQTLDSLAEEMKEFNPQTVAVRAIGHTSRTGAADLNLRLSEQRAQTVVDYLKSLGVNHNMLAEGRGFNEPLGNVAPADARNQRTEIRLVRLQS